MTFDIPPTATFSLAATCPSHCKTEVRVGHHTVVIDEPTRRGGTDSAATPLETLLSSHLACTNVILNMIATEERVQIGDMSMELTVQFDTGGISTTTPTEVPFPEMALTVDMSSDATPEQVDTLKTEIARRCPVSVILRRSGTAIAEIWNVRPL